METGIYHKLNQSNQKFLTKTVEVDRKSIELNKVNFWMELFTISLSVLLIIGIVFSLSSSYSLSNRIYNNPFQIFLRQLLWFAIGILGMLITTRISTSFYSKYIKLIVLFGIIIGILPFIPGIGKGKGEAMRWVNLGVFSFSSSEVMKLILAIYLPVVISRKGDTKKFLNSFLPLFIVTVTFFFIVSLQLDLSNAILILVCAIILMFIGGIPLSHIVITLSTSLLMVFLWTEKFNYIQDRILAFVDPWSDPFNKGYHSIQFLKVFGNGIFGAGLGNGIMKEKYLPEPHTDSIFSVIVEETGLVGSLITIAALTIFFISAMKLASMVNDKYKSLLIVGMASLISIWAISNIMVATLIIPPTGTNFPFLSYGGTNTIVSFLSVGIIYRVYKEAIASR
jgi:cell division protein FtsW